MTARFGEKWEVPAHDVALYGEKRHAHALVIPVINEGERIRAQLLRTQAAGLPVDVIVADGGSTDGSLDAEFIETAGVRAVLTKTGSGKLSAQLRMAYAWCLTEGYEGIVTIDGNGKDGVEAVADFVAKLKDGCDYVQGSRYLPGGEAENTPLERTIANRFIHAPMLSLAGRHWFTDTTNGFRAYSARYLTHPEVQPFRDEFQVYGLLFYLTVRAGQLGLKVDQVPVQRRYPDDGKVPTKIGGLSSKLALLGETVHAATGGFTPDGPGARLPSLGWAVLVAALIVLPLFLNVLVAPPFSPDSWAFYELSKTVFGDFYRFSHWRSYGDAGAYSSAFPPLYPVLIALVDGAFGTGARTGLYIAFAAFIAFATLSESIGRRVTGAAWIGLAASLLLLLGPKMLVPELSAGRTIPLQLCIFAGLIWLFLQGRRITAFGAFAIGIIAGLAVMLRFDAALLPVIAAAVTGWLTRRPSRAIVALGGSIVAVSPWIAYSLGTFGTVFATDNAGVLTSLDPRAFVTDWWPQPQPALADDPAAWFGKLAANIGGFTRNAASLLFSWMGVAIATVTIAIGVTAHFVSRRPGHRAPDNIPSELFVLAGAFAAAMLMMGPQVLTGYLEYRYYSPLFWTAFLAILCWLVVKGTSRTQRAIFGCISFGLVLAFTIPWSVASIAAPDFDPWDSFEKAEDVTALEQCIEDTPRARILVFGDDTFAARAGALAEISTMMAPRNLSEGRLDEADAMAFAKEWQVDYVLFRSETRQGSSERALASYRIPGCALALYAIKR